MHSQLNTELPGCSVSHIGIMSTSAIGQLGNSVMFTGTLLTRLEIATWY